MIFFVTVALGAIDTGVKLDILEPTGVNDPGYGSAPLKNTRAH